MLTGVTDDTGPRLERLDDDERRTPARCRHSFIKDQRGRGSMKPSFLRTIRGALALAVVLALLVPGVAVPVVSAQTATATISTERDKYSPGQTVTFFGSGFQAGETVAVEAVGDFNFSQVTSQAIADESGNIRGSFDLPPVYELNYSLTARGATSDRVANGSFKDPIDSITISPTTASITAGSTQVFTATTKDGAVLVAGTPVQWTTTDPSGSMTPTNEKTCLPGSTSQSVPACTGNLTQGQVSSTYTAGTANGTYLVTAKTGNNEASATVTVTGGTTVGDTTAPDTSITNGPADGSSTTSTSASFTFTGTDNVTPAASLTFECKLDSGDFAACTSPKEYTGLAVGQHTFEVRAKDQANNVDGTPASRTWTITSPAPPPDTTPPAKPTLDLAADSDGGSSNTDNITNDATPTFSGTAEAGSTVELFDGTTSLGTTTADSSGNWSKTVSALSDGVHSITAKATDASNNTSVPSDALSVTIDTAAPTVSEPDLDAASDSGSSNSDNITNDTTPTFSGTASRPRRLTWPATRAPRTH